MRELLEKMISDHSGRSLEDVSRDIERDKILTAQQAVDYGLIDAVIESRKGGDPEKSYVARLSRGGFGDNLNIDGLENYNRDIYAARGTIEGADRRWQVQLPRLLQPMACSALSQVQLGCAQASPGQAGQAEIVNGQQRA